MTSKSQTNLPNSWKLANLCEVAELNPRLDKQQKAFLKHEAFHGNEIVANTRRLCLMNMFLHNIGENRRRRAHFVKRFAGGRCRPAF